MRLRTTWFAVVGLALACGGGSAAPDPLTQDLEALKTAPEILQAVFAEGIRHWPVYAVSVGDRTVDAELDDLSEAEMTKFYARMAKLEQKLATLDVAKLSADEQLSHDLALTTVKDAAARKLAKTELWEVSNLVDPIDNVAYSVAAQSIGTQAQLDALLARYAKIPAFLTQRLANLEKGAAENLVASKPVLEALIANADTWYGLPAADGNPFAGVVFASGVGAADQSAWQTKVNGVVDMTLAPAFKQFAEGLKTKVLPKAREGYGAGALGEQGAAYYASQIAFHTGSTQSPDELHQLGLGRVAELTVELKKQLVAVGIDEANLVDGLKKAGELPESMPAAEADLKAFVTAFDAQLRADAWSKNVWGLGAPAAPSYAYPNTSGTPYYVLGTASITVPLKSATLVSTPSVLAHEFTHYLQDLASQGAMPVSKYQPIFGSYVLSEGTAHYAETVALRTALYERPTPRETALVKFSAYSDLMLRAVRLVVDTGIHAKGWTRQQAVDYLRSHVLMSDAQVEFEVDRYASWPAQALAYRLGMERIAAQHDRAKQQLGAQFDEGAFHKLVLTLSGASTRLLEQRTDAFIAKSGN